MDEIDPLLLSTLLLLSDCDNRCEMESPDGPWQGESLSLRHTKLDYYPNGIVSLATDYCPILLASHRTSNQASVRSTAPGKGIRIAVSTFLTSIISIIRISTTLGQVTAIKSSVRMSTDEVYSLGGRVSSLLQTMKLNFVLYWSNFQLKEFRASHCRRFRPKINGAFRQ